jgi:hypothetical protein
VGFIEAQAGVIANLFHLLKPLKLIIAMLVGQPFPEEVIRVQGAMLTEVTGVPVAVLIPT